jgi:hypothetical protein
MMVLGKQRVPGIVVVVALAAAIVGSALAAERKDIHKNAISASVSFTAGEVLLYYRFFGEVSPPVSEIVGTINGEPLLEPSLRPFPDYGAKSAMLVLLDMTEPSRTAQIFRDKLDAFLLLGKAPRHLSAAIALYSDKLQLVESRTDSPLEDIKTTAFSGAKTSPANLGAALQNAIKLIGEVSADRLRRDVVIFTDGHADDAINANEIISMANSLDVAVTFILSDSQRSVDALSLLLIASETGGRLLSPLERSNFDDFFSYPNSGGLVRFPIREARRYFWQRQPEIKIAFVHGDKQTVLTAPAPLPIAGPIETARYLGSNHPFIAGGSGLAVVALVAGGVFLLRRRRASAGGDAAPERPPELSERKTVYAVLQNIDDGTSHAISSAQVTLGRAGGNDIVIEDKAVSREHAVIRRGDDGVFVVENKGSNGTTVNHLEVAQAELSDGDLITIGDTTLRFVRTKA